MVHLHQMKLIHKSVKHRALAEFNNLNRTLEDLKGILYTQYQMRFSMHFGVEGKRSAETWENYCIQRDVFLMYLGKIDLNNEIRTLGINEQIFNHKSNYNREHHEGAK
jgi:hypothetical protein